MEEIRTFLEHLATVIDPEESQFSEYHVEILSDTLNLSQEFRIEITNLSTLVELIAEKPFSEVKIDIRLVSDEEFQLLSAAYTVFFGPVNFQFNLSSLDRLEVQITELRSMYTAAFDTHQDVRNLSLFELGKRFVYKHFCEEYFPELLSTMPYEDIKYEDLFMSNVEFLFPDSGVCARVSQKLQIELFHQEKFDYFKEFNNRLNEFLKTKFQEFYFTPSIAFLRLLDDRVLNMASAKLADYFERFDEYWEYEEVKTIATNPEESLEHLKEMVDAIGEISPISLNFLESINKVSTKDHVCTFKKLTESRENQIPTPHIVEIVEYEVELLQECPDRVFVRMLEQMEAMIQELAILKGNSDVINNSQESHHIINELIASQEPEEVRLEEEREKRMAELKILSETEIINLVLKLEGFK